MGKKKQRKPGAETKSGFKSKVRAKGRQSKLILTFDDQQRQEFLTGFHKRKEERRKAAVEEIKNKIKEEQKRVREERHKEYLRMLKERKEALEDVDDLDDVITSKTECVQYDHPNHTVTVTTISDLDLSGAGLLTPLTNHNQQEARASDEEEERKNDEEEPVQALPRKAGNPLLSKKIQSLTASLNTFTKQKRKKGQTNFRGRSQQQGDKPSAATGNKRRLGKTTKKQRRKRTGNKQRSQD